MSEQSRLIQIGEVVMFNDASKSEFCTGYGIYEMVCAVSVSLGQRLISITAAENNCRRELTKVSITYSRAAGKANRIKLLHRARSYFWNIIRYTQARDKNSIEQATQQVVGKCEGTESQ